MPRGAPRYSRHPVKAEPTPIPARPAATVMVARDSAEPGVGIEVFLLRRTTGAAFAAGMFVFPGGRVDDLDGAGELEPFSDGLDDATASRLLGLERGGLAYWVAAIRECFEESGLLLAHRRDGTPLPTPPAVGDRVAVHDGVLSMLELCRRDELVLDTGALRYVAHWVTPAQERARRFDTRFFLTGAPRDHHGVHDEVETIDSVWLAPGEALRRAMAGEMTLMPPTIAGLQLLDGCASVADALAKADALGPPPRIEPRLVFDAAGRVVGAAVGDQILPMTGAGGRTD